MRALSRVFPRHHKVLATTRGVAPIVPLVAAFDEVAVIEPFQPLPQELRGANVAVDLHGRGPGSHRVLVASRPNRLIAYANEEVAESLPGPTWRDGEHEVRRWCRLLEENGIPADPDDLDLACPPPPVHLPDARGATIVHAGAAFESRRWPVNRWAQIVAHERACGRRVLLTGAREEAGIVAGVAQKASLDPEFVLAGRTGVLELAAMVGVAGRVVSVDTGIAHLATALRTPSVVIFGPDPPSRWGPPADRPWHRVLWSGRTGDPRGDVADPGLLQITASDVICALRDLCGPHPQRRILSRV
jgi:ADP-heptose:LPS heptosyltransferase